MAPLHFPLARALLLSLALCASRAAAAPLRPGTPQLSLVLSGLFSQPADVPSRGLGLGLQAGWRLTDQLGLIADAARLASKAGAFTTLGVGLTAILDSTPLAPYLAVSIVRLGPDAVTQTGLATRTALGADWQVTPAFALGLEARTLTPLDTGNGGLVSGAELALRLVFHPALLQ